MLLKKDKNKCWKMNSFAYILGEIYELKAELNSDKRDRKKEAVKKVFIHRKHKKKMKISILHNYFCYVGYCKYDSWKRC